MATDDDVRALIRLAWPVFATEKELCACGAVLRVVGAWHPGGQAGAYVVLGCLACGATRNGGRP